MSYQWYKLVITYDSISWRIYINDTLKDTVPGPGAPLGATSDSLSIGMDLADGATGYPYNFEGIIDDIIVYNRVLSDSEAVHYGDTCGKIITDISSASVVPGGNVVFTVASSIVAATYQWQQDAGTGFVNLTNAGPYSGVTTNTLTISGVTTALNADHYRCLVSNTWGCADTTSSVDITVSTTAVNNVITDKMIHVFPNPAHNNVTVQLPNISSGGSIQLINEVGQILSKQNINGNSVTFDLDSLSAGMYILKIQINGQVMYKKVLKN